MKQFESNYPGLIHKPYESLQAAKGKNSEAERHFTLIDLGESLLAYVAGILLGEYKKSGVINKKIETELYRLGNKNLSFGHYQHLVRLIHKEMDDSIVHEKLHKSHNYDEAANLVMSFDILKKLVDDGLDEEFTEKAEAMNKGRTAKNTGFLDFFDCFIKIRNIKAHPDGKAGPKDNLRKWPLTEEYYAYINDHLEPALMEIINDLEILSEFRCARATEEIEDEARRARFVLEAALGEQNVDLTLTREQITMLSNNQRFLLSPENQLFIRLFYNTIPQINKQVYKEISEAEKAKQMEPHLKQMIRDKLSDDQRIDELEYLVLHDTAKMVSMSEEQLFGLIDKIRKELSIEASPGTPEEPGDLFVKEKEGDKRLTFNPWWLHYFSLLPTIDQKEVKGEKARMDKFDDRIEKISSERKGVLEKIKIKEGNKKKEIKTAKDKKRDIKAKADQKLKDLKEANHKAKTAERKEKLKNEKKEAEEKLNDKLEDIDLGIKRISEEIASLKQERESKKAEHDAKIKQLEMERESELKKTTWGRHKYLWKELDQYVDGLLYSNLNNAEWVANEEDEEDEKNVKSWINESASWQAGRLYGYYWGKIRPAKAPLGDLFHIGIWIGREFQWMPKDVRSPELKERLKLANVVMWPSTNDIKLNKVDTDGQLTAKYRELKKQFIDEYMEKLLPLNLNVRCRVNSRSEGKKYGGFLNDENDLGAFVPLATYKQDEQDYSMPTLYSSIWTLEDLYDDDGLLDLPSVHRLESQMETLLGWFSNIIAKVNEHALELGIDAEYIQRKEEQFGRHQATMHEKFKAATSQGKFNPTKEQIEEWKAFAKEELDLNEYLFNLILNGYRFKSRGNK